MNTRTLRIVHRWLAFILGIFVVFQITSGSVAKENRMLMQWSSPNFYGVENNATPATPGEIFSSMSRLEPDFNIAHVMVPPPDEQDTAYILMGGRNPEKPHEARLLLNFNQYDQSVIGERSLMASGWVGTLSVLHRWILFGEAGFYVVTLLGLVTILMSVSGVYLYAKTRRASVRLPLINRLHRSMGAVASIFLIVTSASGIAMSYVYWQDRADNLSVFANLMTMDTDMGMEASMEKRYVDPDIAYATAQSAIPDGYHLSAYSYASAHSPNYWFAFHDDRLFRQDVVITGHSGEIKGVYPAGKLNKGDGMRNALLPIHTGYYFGAIGGFLMTFFGFVVMGWLLSGIWIYVSNRRQASH
jgi:uncharacterized iron-regulated membrane protein